MLPVKLPRNSVTYGQKQSQDGKTGEGWAKAIGTSQSVGSGTFVSDHNRRNVDNKIPPQTTIFSFLFTSPWLVANCLISSAHVLLCSFLLPFMYPSSARFANVQSPDKLSTFLWPRKSYYKTFLIFNGFKMGVVNKMCYPTSLDSLSFQLCFPKNLKNLYLIFNYR